MEPAVSVVVPVFEPGPFIRPLLDALDLQEPVEGGFEAIFVDDGSTDATGPLLDRWTASRPWARVIHQPNSGWPSRPRNVGAQAAHGEFIFFVDHDDSLTVDALRVMVDFARSCGSDVVLGRMRSAGRKVPTVLFRHTVADAHAPTVPLQDSMTTHAMFRRAFLVRHAIRFDETVRRVEDHLFMTDAYTRAGIVSVYADSDVYVHTARTDGGGAGYRRYDPAAYYRDLSRAITTVCRAWPAGPERDAYLVRWMRIELVGRLQSDAVRWLPSAQREAFATAIRATIAEAMPDDIVARLPAHWRWPAALALCATTEQFLCADDVLTLSTRAALAKTPGSERLASAVPADVLARARALLGGDPPLPTGRAATGGRQARRRRRRRWALEAVTGLASGRIHHALVDWGRTPALLVRQAVAAAVPVTIAAAIAGALTGHGVIAVGMTAAGAAGTVALSVRSLRSRATTIRFLLCQLPALIALLRDGTAVGAVAWTLSVACVVAADILDRRWRRRDVRAHARRTPAPRRMGAIALTASAVAATVCAAATIAWIA